MEAVYEDSLAEPSPHWKRYVVGAGALEPAGSALRFVVAGAASRKYSGAQIDDYQGLPRRRCALASPTRRQMVRRGSPQDCAAPPASVSGTTPS